MKAHENQFDEHWVFHRLKSRMGIEGEVKGWVGKVRSGAREGEGAGTSGLTPELDTLLDEVWNNAFASVTGMLCDAMFEMMTGVIVVVNMCTSAGVMSYEDLRAQISLLSTSLLEPSNA